MIIVFIKLFVKYFMKDFWWIFDGEELDIP